MNDSSSGSLPSQKRSNVFAGIIAVCAVVIRLLIVWRTHSYLITAERDHFEFGFEAGRIARSLVLGNGFSSPMPYPTGPTAHLAPIYPFLLNCIFRVFGIYTAASAFAAFVINSLADAVTCIICFRLGSRIFNPRTGLMAAAFFAIYPNAIWLAAGTIWDASLSALCMAAIALWLYRLPDNPTVKELVMTGIWIGLAGLLNPAICLPASLGFVWIWARLRRSGPERLWKPALAAAVTATVILPWMIRNAVRVGEFTPRSTFGICVRQGNSEAAWSAGTGEFQISMTATDSPVEAKRLLELGEAAYDRECLHEGLDAIRRSPEKFARLTAARIWHFWLGYDSAWTGNFQVGMNLARFKSALQFALAPFVIAGAVIALYHRKRVLLLLAMIVVYPLPYYVTVIATRYRFPVDPFCLILAAFCVATGWEALASRRKVESTAAPVASMS